MKNKDKIVYTLNEIINENEEIMRPGTPRALLIAESKSANIENPAALDHEEEEYEVSSGLLRDSEADEWVVNPAIKSKYETN